MGVHKPMVHHDTRDSGCRYTIADYINVRAKAAGLSQRAIAAMTGIDRSRINRVLREDDRLPISVGEATIILGSMGVGHLEVALANEFIESSSDIDFDEMATILSLIAGVVDGLPTKLASLLEKIDGLEASDIRREHGVRVQMAIVEMLKALYTTVTVRKNERIDPMKF